MGKIYFSDYFSISPDIVGEYGAFNVSLVNDLPLFIDPFRLFNSKNTNYQKLHDRMIEYVRFLRDKSMGGQINEGLLKAWYTFPEVKQNWLGFSRTGNKGHGLGMDFARSLHRSLDVIFTDFGSEKITRGSHIEKVCLIRSGIGRDNISDFTTNLIKDYLLKYTQRFAARHLATKDCGRVMVPKVTFNYTTETWESREFNLPFWDGDYVVLTPKNILTRDDMWINRGDLVDEFQRVAVGVDNDVLRAQINNYFLRVLPRKEKLSKKERRAAISKVLERYPILLEYYIRSKERRGKEAESLSERNVDESEAVFIRQTLCLIKDLGRFTPFYSIRGDTLAETRARVEFLKDVIENKGGHRLFYANGSPIRRESDLHIMFRFTWIGTSSDVSREVNDGRGPVDFKVSRGAFDKSLVEFKLASNSQLKRNLDKQVAIYTKASDTKKSLKVIVYFSEKELLHVLKVLEDLDLQNDKDVILIDARADTKPSGSKA